MTTSEQIGEIAKALASAQGEIQPAVKDTDNPFYKSSYADFNSIREACRAPLSKYGIALVQGLSCHDGAVHVTTRLIHVSGQWISSVASSVPKDFSPQGIGSASTYLRRYSLSAMVGISQYDDDGNEASGKTQEPQAYARQAPGPVLAPKPATGHAEPSKAPIPVIKPTTNPDWKMTKEIGAVLSTAAKASGYDEDTLRNVIAQRYAKDAFKDLTQENYNDLLSYVATYRMDGK